MGNGQTANYETPEENVTHSIKLSLGTTLLQDLYKWQKEECAKEVCSKRDLDGNCVKRTCEKYYYSCNFYSKGYVQTLPLILTSSTTTVAPPYTYIEPVFKFTEGKMNILEIWFDKNTLNSIRFEINGLYYQEDYNKFGLDFWETDHIEVTSQETFRQTNTLRLLDSYEQGNVIYVKVEIRNPSVVECTVKTTDYAFNHYEYACPEIRVIPQPLIILRKDGLIYRPGEKLILGVDLVLHGNTIPGIVTITYAGKEYLVEITTGPVTLELEAKEGLIIAEYEGSEEYSPQTKESYIKFAQVSTPYWKLVLKYVVLFYLFFRLIWWLIKKWRVET